MGWCATPDWQAEYPLGEFGHPWHNRTATCQYNPAPQFVEDTGSIELFFDQGENFLDTKFDDFAESPPWQRDGVAPTHPRHLDHLSWSEEIDKRTAMTLFQFFCFGQRCAQPGCQVIDEVRPTNRQEGSMLN